MTVPGIDEMPQDLGQRLIELAKRLEKPASLLVTHAIREYVEREEQMHRDTLEALDDYKNGRTVDGDEVIAWIDSWGTEQELPRPQTRQ